MSESEGRVMALRWCGVAAMIGMVAGCAPERESQREAPYELAPDPLADLLSVACDGRSDALYAVPRDLEGPKGSILHCVDDGVISQDELNGRLSNQRSDSRSYDDDAGVERGVLNTYQGPEAAGAIHVYRISYRTERGNGDPGYAVATVYVPVQTNDGKLPIVILARGSRGQAPACAPSVRGDGPFEVWPLVAAGFAVVATDSAGYAGYGKKGIAPSAYADVADMGKSLLDSGRAMRALMPSRFNDDVFLVGLSQGGHSALGALEVANEYGAPGTIKAVVAHAPLWFAQRAWGALMVPLAASLGLDINAGAPLPVSFWYHYTHAELYDGPGSGAQLFNPSVRDAIEQFMDETCWMSSYPALAAVGTTAADFFVPELIAAVAEPAFTNGDCTDSPDVALCERWLGRYRRDHPVLTGTAAKVPILIAYGLEDTTISKERMQCALDKLALSKNPVELCVDPEAGHGGIVLTQAAYTTEWLRNKAFGDPITAECPQTSLPKGLTCDSLVQNDPP